jgi:transposase
MKARRRYTSEFKQQAVDLVENGRPVPEVAMDLEIEADLVYRWRREREAQLPQATQVGSGAQRAVGEEGTADELRRLRAENAQLKSENIILKKAAVILGTEPQPKITK